MLYLAKFKQSKQIATKDVLFFEIMTKGYFWLNFVAFGRKKSPKYSLFPVKYYFRISSITLERVITAATVRTVTLTQASRSLLLLKGWQINKGNHLLRVYETLYWKSFSERLFLWFKTAIILGTVEQSVYLHVEQRNAWHQLR